VTSEGAGRGIRPTWRAIGKAIDAALRDYERESLALADAAIARAEERIRALREGGKQDARGD
jgi:hypothetical protein